MTYEFSCTYKSHFLFCEPEEHKAIFIQFSKISKYVFDICVLMHVI